MVRDHYFEVRPDGLYIYLGSTNPEAVTSREEADKFFSGGITRPIIVIRGLIETIDPPPEEIIENCPDCGHAVSKHANTRGVNCLVLGCNCTTSAAYLYGDDLAS